MRRLDFIITGLPRSGLAWTANYLTYDNTLCLFDAFKNGAKDSGPDCIQKMLNDAPIHIKNIGIADHGALLFQDYLIDKYPDTEWVVIDRKYKDCVDAAEKVIGTRPDMTVMDEKLKELRAKLHDYSKIPYETLALGVQTFSRRMDMFCSSERHRMLSELNVQMNPQIAFEQAKIVPFDNPLRRAAELPNPTTATLEYYNLLTEMCGDNKSAFDFVDQTIEAALFFDHVYDEDPISRASQDKVMKSLMILWPMNPFVRQYAAVLAPAMAMSIQAWKNGDDYGVYSTIFLTVAFCLGGTEYVDRYGLRIKSIVQQAKAQDDERDNDQSCGTLSVT